MDADLNSIISDQRVHAVWLWRDASSESVSLTVIGSLYGKEVAATAYRTSLDIAIRDVRRQLDEAFQHIERGV